MATALLLRLLHSASAFRRSGALRLAALWSPSARAQLAARKGWAQRLRNAFKENTAAPTLWCHLAAPSDYAICRPVIAKFQSVHPDWRFLITLQDSAPLPAHKFTNSATLIDILPIDTPRNAQRFLAIAAPAVAVATRHHTQFGNFLAALQKNSIPTYLIAAKYSAPPSPFKWVRGQLRRWLSLYTWIFTPDSFTVDILSQHGITHVACAGNTLFDSIAQAQTSALASRFVERLATARNVIIAANTTEEDEAALLPLLWNLPPEWCLVAIPDALHETRIAAWLQRVNRPYCRTSTSPTPDALARCALLLLDDTELPIGIYRYASLAYIGGGFANRLSNVLEPAAYGLPTIYGARHHNCPEALELRECNASAAPYSPSQVANLCLSLIDNPTIRAHMGQRANDYFAQHVGSSDTILRRVEADIHLANIPYEST